MTGKIGHGLGHGHGLVKNPEYRGIFMLFENPHKKVNYLKKTASFFRARDRARDRDRFYLILESL